jgi:hypothetical protein
VPLIYEGHLEEPEEEWTTQIAPHSDNTSKQQSVSLRVACRDRLRACQTSRPPRGTRRSRSITPLHPRKAGHASGGAGARPLIGWLSP